MLLGLSIGLSIGVTVGAAVGMVLGVAAFTEGGRHFGLGCDAEDAGPCGNAVGMAGLLLGGTPGVILGGLIGGAAGMALAEKWLVGRRRSGRTP